MSSRRSGRINLTLNSVTYYRGFYPFLNAWKTGAAIQVINNGISYWSDIPPDAPNSAWNKFLDDYGELVRRLPADTTQMERIFYSPPRDGLPDGYNRFAEPWVLKWDGTASEVNIVPASSQLRVGNRIEWVWGVKEGQQRVVFSRIDLNDPPHNIRVCEARHEGLLDAGEFFNPDWLAKVREGFGIVRFMGWQNTNGDASSRRFSDIPEKNYCSWGGAQGPPTSREGCQCT